MKPYYERDGITIYHGDCREVLPTLDAESIHAVVTDPPYGIGFAYTSGDDVATTPAAYGEWIARWYPDVLRILRPGGLVAMWQSYQYFRYYWDWYGDDLRIYAACKNFVQLRKTPINSGYDPVVMRYKAGALPLRPTNPARSVDFFVADTASIVSNKRRVEKGHPCPRPLDQVREIIANFALPGGVILDPFAGSGTTLRAALDLGCRGIGVEREERYCEIAARRLQQAVLPLGA